MSDPNAPGPAFPTVHSPQDSEKPFMERLAERSRNSFLRMCKRLQPMEILTEEYNVMTMRIPPRLLWWGIPITEATLTKYAKKRGFWRSGSDMTELDRLLWAERDCTRFLRNLTKYSQLELRYPYSLEYSWVVGIYSSYKIHDEVLTAVQEDKLIRVLKRELEVDLEPIWFFDQENYDEDYLWTLAQRQAKKIRKRKAERLALESAAVPTTES
ncbi:hypothetical protein BC834DRAFT_971234 [Gloeopeniophorella convolvens]|nr:hypothetical protein BC834DRAFT_971234 [Gloeopeniophorella convolvens]